MGSSHLTALIGYVLHRTISVPVRHLIGLTDALGAGDRSAIDRPRQHGTKEFAALSQGFRAMATRLTERTDAVSTFAAHVSHELKSPLTAIHGAAELLRDDIDANGADGPAMSPEARRRFLDHIVTDTRRLDALLQRLRDFARAEEAPTIGTSALRPVVEDLRQAIATLDLKVSGDLDEAVHLSPDTLLIVLSHLADNAGRHGATRLDLVARRDGSAMEITIQDNGTGISASNRARIFDPFFTTRRESGGTGMGLAIARSLLTAHGGSIVLIDAPAGAGFSIVVPACLPPMGEVGSFDGPRSLVVGLALIATTIVTGLALRHIGPVLGLPFSITKYGGSILWGAMVYGAVAVVRPGECRWRLAAALVIAVTVEALRLVHTPMLDAFRAGTLGGLLLGRVFSAWDVLAYAVGILAANGAMRVGSLRHIDVRLLNPQASHGILGMLAKSHGRDLGRKAGAPTEQPPRKLSGKRTV